MDNWFTSIPISDKLKDVHEFTVVGTVISDKSQLAVVFKSIKNHPIYSCIFAFRPDCTVMFYAPKNKTFSRYYIQFMSQMQLSTLMEKPKNTYSIILQSHQVDVIDEMKNAYSVSNISRHFPLTVMFSILNVGSINSCIDFQSVSQRKIGRLQFLKDLACSLCSVHMINRTAIISIPRYIKLKIKEIFVAIEEPFLEQRERPVNRQVEGRGRCQQSGYKKSGRTILVLSSSDLTRE